ncbi:MAG: zf-TFIIB domain-containing protein [Labilithrix sp.]|nr:zf-TFIIB domain-containing protein [Labilithrix sp.]
MSDLGPAPGGPYRASCAVAAAPLDVTCPYCGNTCSATLRVCPSCDVRFESVRCASCYTLQPPGTFSCGRCRRPLELEAALDVTDAPCPRCTSPLEAAGGAGEWVDARLHECPRCGGMFVPRDALADILCRAEQGGPLAALPERGIGALEQVRYIPCPLCRSSMNRMNFGKVSGVIVDVCRAHGTWFDGGELTRVVAFAASGGLGRTREREERERKEREEHARSAFIPPPQALPLQRLRRDTERLEQWRSFLGALFSW